MNLNKKGFAKLNNESLRDRKEEDGYRNEI